MNKITISVLLVLTVLFMAFLSGCQPNATARELLSNTGTFSVNYITVPRNAFSSHDGTYSNDEDINDNLQKFINIEFISHTKISVAKMLDFARGSYGLPFDESKWSEHMIIGSDSEKYLIKIVYENENVGVLLVDYDGTAYLLDVNNRTVFKTSQNAVNYLDYYSS